MFHLSLIQLGRAIIKSVALRRELEDISQQLKLPTELIRNK